MSGTDARAAAIAALGYAPREAAFLACVTRHGGYFLRRQFLTWVGRQKGRAVVEFTRRLVARRHATVQTFCRTTHVYHLSARTLYAGGAEPAAAGRRRRPAVAIKTRLMALDFAASRPEITFLATEQERVAYCDRLGIERGRLPQQRVRAYRSAGATVRYFPESFPLGILGADGPSPLVLCAYVDDGARSLAGFVTFLRRHARLLAVLPCWQVAYVSDTPRQAEAAGAVFRKALGHGADAATDDTRAAVGEFFRLRQLYEAKRWAALDKAKLDRFLDLRQRFGHDVDALYARWEIGGDAVLHGTSAASSRQELSARFEAVVLSYTYLATAGARART